MLDPDGRIVLADWATKYGKESMKNFGIFQKSGFAKLDVKIDYKEYKGLMDATGRVEWLFGTGPVPSFENLPGEPEPIEPPIGGTPPPGPIPVDPRKPPVGPKTWTAHTFSVTVAKEGEGTVSVSQSSGIKYGDPVTFTATHPSDPLMALYINMAMAFDGHSSPDCIPRRYRIEMLDRDDDKDEFTFGEMQTYSTKSGNWVDSQSKEIRKVTKGLIVTKVDKGLPTDLVKDVRMKLAQKRTDVSWYPPLVWYDGNESSLRHAVEQMGNAYRSFKSDYYTLFGK